MKDYREVIDYFNRCQISSGKGDMEAMLELGKIYGSGVVLEENDKAAFECFSKAAETGDPDAEFELGLCYYLGIGTEKDLAKGYRLILNSSENGNLDAMSFLGAAYVHGNGVKMNFDKGIELLTRASEMGNVRAMEILAALYYMGVGVEEDSEMHNALVRSAASLGGTESKFILGYAMMHDMNGESDPKKGEKLLREASDEGSPIATKEYMAICMDRNDNNEALKRADMLLEQVSGPDLLYEAGLILLRDRSHMNVETALRLFEAAKDDNVLAYMQMGRIYSDVDSPLYNNTKAFDCYYKAAEMGEVRAFGLVGSGFEKGMGVTRDPFAAEAWYTRGVNENNGDCQLRLAIMRGKGVLYRPDHHSALKLAKKAFFNGINYAAFKLSEWYETWEDCRSISDSIYWLMEGAKKHEPYCMKALADHYRSGTYIKEDPEKAFDLYKELSECPQLSDVGLAEIGRFYEEGTYVKKNPRKARFYYLEAAKRRNAFAIYRLHESAKRSNLKDEMIFWLMASARAGSVSAMMDLAYRYETGDCVPKSKSEAIRWYHEASERGNREAKENMAQLLLMEDFEETPTAAFSFIFNAARDMDGNWMMKLGKARRDGTDGFRVNLKQSRRWMELGQLFGADMSDEDEIFVQEV